MPLFSCREELADWIMVLTHSGILCAIFHVAELDDGCAASGCNGGVGAASRATSSRADAFIAAAHTDSHAPIPGDATAAHAAVSSATAALVASAASAFGAPAACRSDNTVSPHVGREITDGGAGDD